MSAHLHRKHSWARLRERAAAILKDTGPLPESKVELAVLLLCILGATGAGLVVAGVLNLLGWLLS